jgi:uncharacterized protein DUF4328
MLCSNCRKNTATTDDGLCDGCPAVPVVDLTLPGRPAERRPGVLRSPVGLSYAVVALLCIVVAADVFSMFAAAGLRNLMGTAYSETDLEQALSVTDAAGVVQGVAQIATAVVFIIWFHQVRANADVFAPDLQRRGRGWAIGGWFVPIGNFYLPRAIAADIWAASRQDPYGTGKQEPHTIINVWWIAWLVANLVNGIAGAQYDMAQTADEFRAGTDAFIVGGLVDIGAALLAVVVVRRLTRMQLTKAMRGAGEVAV